jgi:hypothetical protein
MILRMKKLETIRICPQCMSPDVETDFSNAAAVGVGFINNSFKCNHCGHAGTFFPKISVKDLKKPLSKKEVKNVKHVDMTFAKGYFGVEFFVAGIFFLLFGIILLVYGAFSQGLVVVTVGAILTGFYFYRRYKLNLAK